MTAREHQLEQVHTQLVHWQENLANCVAGEAELLDVEIGKLRDDDLEDALRLLHTAHTQILAGCDIVRDLRRKVQQRYEA